MQLLLSQMFLSFMERTSPLTLCKQAISVAHLTNFFFEFFKEIFTEDASLLLLFMVQNVKNDQKHKSPRSCLKGAVSRYSVTFCDFCVSKKWRLLAQVSGTSDLKPAGRPGSLATYAGDWQCIERTTSRARVALLHLSTTTGSTFLFKLRSPSKVISPSWRFKISSDSSVDIDSLFFCFVLRTFRGLLRRSRCQEHGWLEKESAVWL